MMVKFTLRTLKTLGCTLSVSLNDNLARSLFPSYLHEFLRNGFRNDHFFNNFLACMAGYWLIITFNNDLHSKFFVEYGFFPGVHLAIEPACIAFFCFVRS